jgi:hypothetical protein
MARKIKRIKLKRVSKPARGLSFGAKLKGFIVMPVDTFKAIKGESFGKAFGYYALISLIYSVILGIIFGIVFILMARGTIPGFEDLLFIPDIAAALFIPIIIITMYLSNLISFFIESWILHLGVLIFARQRRGLIETYKAVAYGSTPVIFSFVMIIPYLGYVALFLIGVWALVIEILGLKELHGTTAGRATAAALVIPIIITVIVAILFLAFFRFLV